jgi:quercetin dioxygenase-like cupin family protein
MEKGDGTMATRPQATATVRIENGRVKATEWAFVPGAETGWHIHGYDYVIVPLTDGRLLLEEPDGATRRADLTLGIPYQRNAGVEHNVVNDGEADLRFLEVEIVG